jgi:hypothetical protein
MYPRYPWGALVCPKCNNLYEPVDDEIIHDFEAIICHNIETESYEIEACV